MRVKNLARSALAAAALGIGALAYSGEEDRRESGGRLRIGLEYLNFGDKYKYEHQTHPEDRSFMPGSPGETGLRAVGGFEIGGEAFRRIEERFQTYAGASIIFLGGRDEHQNDNDIRPASGGSFVYTQVGAFSPRVRAGIDYELDESWSVGASLSGTWVWIEHGWDRYGSDEPAEREDDFLFNAGLKMGYRFEEGAEFSLELLKGINNRGGSAQMGLKIEF